MDHNICLNCGGSLHEENGKLVCEYCGSYRPQNISSEEITLLTTAYQKLRLTEFSEAEAEFDDIIRKYPQCAQAYWGRLLARYGIKYEKDYDGRLIPTCYASIESISQSSDYQNALQYADSKTRDIYIMHAEYIDKIRKKYLEKAQKEKPYDIFISFKDSDRENGSKRTRDSYDAESLYYHLKDEGYRVFFSRESLKGISGRDYEPYIFNALSTAKVMIVFGSNPEYINTTWVKNEWMRYLKCMRAGEKKEGSLLVAYKGFDPRELPNVLSRLQCLDADDMYFYSNLKKAVESILRDGTTTCNHTKTVTVPERPATCTQAGLSEGKYCETCGVTLKTPTYIQPKGHKFGEWKIAKKATCTENGKYERVCHCGATETRSIPSRGGHIASEEWETVTKPAPGKKGLKAKKCVVCGAQVERKEIPALPKRPPINKATKLGLIALIACLIFATGYLIFRHKHTLVTEPSVAPTCMETGITERIYCVDCGKILKESTPIDALGHIPNTEIFCTEAQICTVCGEELNPARGHTPGAEATCTEAQSCTMCGQELKPSLGGHTPGTEATCTEAQACTVCGEELKSALGHTFQWVIKKNPSQTEEGLRVYQCSVCGTESATESIPTASEGLAYHVNADRTTCTITGIGTCTETDVRIPKAIDGYWVTNIGNFAFINCNNLTSIVIPNSVMSIGDYAFDDCTSLQSITIPDSVMSIGDRAFWSCDNLTSIEIPNSVMSIGDEAFWSCDNLTDIIVHNDNSHYCDLDGILFNKNVTELICYPAGKSESTYTIPDSVTSIGNSAFGSCDSLISIEIPDSVMSIGNFAFSNCDSLTSIEISDSVTNIGSRAFYGCNGLTEIVVNDSNQHYCDLNGVLFNKNITELICYPEGKTANTYTIPDSVLRVGDAAFAWCTNLTSIGLPNILTSIGDDAFYYCRSLTSIVIPNSVMSIGDEAFLGCTSLTSIELPDSVASIGISTFANCSKLTTITVDDGNQHYCDLNGVLFNKNITELICYPAGKTQTTYTIPDSVTMIDDRAFYLCESLTSIAIPDSVTMIDGWAFSYCRNLTEIRYSGTMAQWREISKHSYWNSHTGSYTVICTDGTIPKSSE